MKKVLFQVMLFVLSNLCCVGVYLIVFVAMNIFASSSFNEMVKSGVFNVLACTIMSFIFVIPFFRIYFLENEDFKNSFLFFTFEKEMKLTECVKEHFRLYGKTELICGAVYFVLLSIVPLSIQWNVGVGFIFASSAFFLSAIPIQVLGVLAWLLYVSVLYLLCLVLAMWKWNREKLHKFDHKEKEIDSRPL